MIKLNKLSRQVCKRFYYSNTFGRNETKVARLYRIKRNWGRLADATQDKHHDLSQFTNEEVAAADVIISTMRYLIENGRNDVEELLRKRLETMMGYD